MLKGVKKNSKYFANLEKKRASVQSRIAAKGADRAHPT